MASRIDTSLLHGRWLHAHEEDTPDGMVFRPAETPLPPARGRTGYEFLGDGRSRKLGPGPADRTARAEGRWRLEGENRIVNSVTGSDDEVLEIASLEPGRLVIKKSG